MLLGFKARFAPMVLDGSKTHTIRAPRARRPRVGEPCHCYTGLRQKGARLLGRWECVRVETIRIQLSENGGLLVRIDDAVLGHDEAVMLARRDGFRGQDPLVEMTQFWLAEGRLQEGDIWTGDVIHWDPKKPVAGPKKARG